MSAGVLVTTTPHKHLGNLLAYLERRWAAQKVHLHCAIMVPSLTMYPAGEFRVVSRCCASMRHC